MNGVWLRGMTNLIKAKRPGLSGPLVYFGISGSGRHSASVNGRPSQHAARQHAHNQSPQAPQGGTARRSCRSRNEARAAARSLARTTDHALAARPLCAACRIAPVQPASSRHAIPSTMSKTGIAFSDVAQGRARGVSTRPVLALDPAPTCYAPATATAATVPAPP
jgi:hypothetical protein